MGNHYSRNKPPEKTPEELELEEKQKQEKYEADKKFFLEKAAFAINIYKQSVLQHALNKNFKVKLPIESINNIPVNVYFVFTESTIENIYHFEEYLEYYNIDLYIHAKWDENKILYNEKINYPTRPTAINFSINDYYRNNSFIKFYCDINYSLNIIKSLNLDSYMECFSKQPPIDYSTICKDNSGIKFEKVYICNSCNGQTKNKNLCCFFCQNMEQ